MRYIAQRFDNDCALACVSMVTGIYYGTLLNAAIERGFIPNNGIGLSVPAIFHWFGYTCRYIDDYYGLDDCEPRIVLIEHTDEDGGGCHAVVVDAGVVHDPNACSPIDMHYVHYNGLGMVYDVYKGLPL